MTRTAVSLCTAIAFNTFLPGQDRPPEPRRSMPPMAAPGFLENRGQWPSRIRFASENASSRVAFTDAGFEFLGPGRAEVIRFRFEGVGAQVAIDAYGERPEECRFFRGGDPATWTPRANSYRSLRYRGLYEGIEVVIRGTEREGPAEDQLFEYDIELSPGARLEDVVVRCEGIEGMSLAPDGELLLRTGAVPLRQLPPRTWWEAFTGERIPARCGYRVLGPDAFGFRLEEPEVRCLRLVIDPVVAWSLPLGSSGGAATWLFDRSEGISAMQRAPSGELIVVGQRTSFDFPEEPPTGEGCTAGEETLGDYDAYVVRVDGEGNLLSVTILGGAMDDGVASIALTADGDIALAGYTESAEFFVTDGSVLAGGQDGFVAVLDPEGCELRFATFFGGWGEDAATAIAIGPEGEIVASGYTASTDLPTTPGCMYPGFLGGTNDQFLLRLAPPGPAGERPLEYATYFGGSAWDARSDQDGSSFLRDRLRDGDLAVRGDGIVVATGRTWSVNLPTTPDAIRRTKPVDWSDGFIGLFRLDGSVPRAEQVVYLSYLGGESNADAPRDLELAGDGSVWVTGVTWSSDYPSTPDAYRRSNAGGPTNTDVFLSRIRFDVQASEQLVYSTFLGGGGDEWDATLALKSDDDVVVGAETESTDLPAHLGEFAGGRTDGMLAVLDTTRSGAASLEFLGYLGGWGTDDVTAIAAGGERRIYVGLTTQSGAPGIVDEPVSNVGLLAALDLSVPRAAIAVEPAAGPAPLHARLDGRGSSTPGDCEIVSYLWDFGQGETEEAATLEREFAFAGRHPVKLTVTNDCGVRASDEMNVIASCPPGDVAPWTAGDVGAPLFPGSARRDAAALALCAGGRGIASAGDELHMAYQERDGDFVLTARLADLSGGNLLAGAGLMVRESVDDEAAFVAILAERRFADDPDDPDDPPKSLYLRARYRVATDADPSSKNLGAIDDYGTEPLWLRLRRTGGTVSAFISRSPEGTFAETPDYEMDFSSEPILAALAAFGRDGTDAARPFRAIEATFEDVDLSDPAVPGPEFIRGDANADGSVDISDGVSILDYLFLGGSPPTCLDADDADDSGEIVITDAVYLLNFLFLGGPQPPAPYPECGTDPTADPLGCDRFDGCP